mgnify:CR=1 FL=1
MSEQAPAAPGANPYATQFEARESTPDLDAQAPELKSSELQRMNRRAVGLLLVLVLLLGMTAIWTLNNVLQPEKKPKPKEEVVSVPAAPSLPPVPPPAPRQAEAIPLVPPPPTLPPLPVLSQAPQGTTSDARGPTLMERRMASASGTVTVASSACPAAQEAASSTALTSGTTSSADQGLPPNTAYRAKSLAPVSNAQPLVHADALMVRGTYIRCVLETRLVTDLPGFTSCVVTEPVYSVTGKRLLLPKGSKVLGKYDMEPNSPRVAVVWDRIITPNGIDVNMASPGVDNLGGAGHPGEVDEHWPRRIASALMISLLADAFKYEAAKYGPQSTTVTAGGLAVQSPYESYTAQTLQSLAGQAVRRSANQPATVTINQGTVVNVYVAKDVDFTDVVAR